MERKKVKIYQYLAATAHLASLWLRHKHNCGCFGVLIAVPLLTPLQGNLQDAAGQPLVLHGQPAPAKPYTSDMDKLGQSPATQSTTPGVQTGTPSVQSGTTVTQPSFQAGLPTMESILKDLSELQGQMSSLQNLARDLQGEKEKVSPYQSLRGQQECQGDLAERKQANETMGSML